MQKKMTEVEDGKQNEAGKQVIFLKERTEGSEQKQSEKSTINIFWANWKVSLCSNMTD